MFYVLILARTDVGPVRSKQIQTEADEGIELAGYRYCISLSDHLHKYLNHLRSSQSLVVYVPRFPYRAGQARESAFDGRIISQDQLGIGELQVIEQAHIINHDGGLSCQHIEKIQPISVPFNERLKTSNTPSIFPLTIKGVP
jgi:hypothetical protein